MSAVPSASARLFAAFLAARLAYGLVFLASALRQWPVLWYLPLERRWIFGTSSEGLGIDWYGRSGLSLLAALVAGLFAFWLSRRLSILSKPGAVLSLAHAGALVLFVDFAYFAGAILTRQPSPWPIPDWYCPR